MRRRSIPVLPGGSDSAAMRSWACAFKRGRRGVLDLLAKLDLADGDDGGMGEKAQPTATTIESSTLDELIRKYLALPDADLLRAIGARDVKAKANEKDNVVGG